jgi:hypothetical protein
MYPPQKAGGHGTADGSFRAGRIRRQCRTFEKSLEAHLQGIPGIHILGDDPLARDVFGQAGLPVPGFVIRQLLVDDVPFTVVGLQEAVRSRPSALQRFREAQIGLGRLARLCIPIAHAIFAPDEPDAPGVLSRVLRGGTRLAGGPEPSHTVTGLPDV